MFVNYKFHYFLFKKISFTFFKFFIIKGYILFYYFLMSKRTCFLVIVTCTTTRSVTKPVIRMSLSRLIFRIKVENVSLWKKTVGLIIITIRNQKLLFTVNNIVRLLEINSGYWCNYYSKQLLPTQHRNIEGIFRKYSIEILQYWKIFIKLLGRFLKYFRNLAMSVQNIINGILLQY